jgi:hypothetical protein
MGAMTAGLVLLLAAAVAPPRPATLPPRITTIVLHTLGGPFYGRPEMRFVFLSPEETFALWAKPDFGAHWIVTPDGSLWPRHPGPGEAPKALIPADGRLTDEWRARLAREAAPVYAHASGVNRESVGIEMAHSGRSTDPFPPPQVRSAAFVIRALIEMSGGRLTEGQVIGHKDVDARPAFVVDACRGPACAYYVDDDGQPYRRRVDPPEGLFAALGAAGVVVPRGKAGTDEHLHRAELMGAGVVPRVVQP